MVAGLLGPRDMLFVSPTGLQKPRQPSERLNERETDYSGHVDEKQWDADCRWWSPETRRRDRGDKGRTALLP